MQTNGGNKNTKYVCTATHQKKNTWTLIEVCNPAPQKTVIKNSNKQEEEEGKKYKQTKIKKNANDKEASKEASTDND